MQSAAAKGLNHFDPHLWSVEDDEEDVWVSSLFMLIKGYSSDDGHAAHRRVFARAGGLREHAHLRELVCAS